MTFDPSYSQLFKSLIPQWGADVQPYLRTGIRIGVLPTVGAAAEGMPIRQIAGGQIKPAFSLLAQPTVNTFSDLKGKIIGVTRLRSLSANLLQAILRPHGLSFSDVKVLSLQTTNNVFVTLDTKQISAGMLFWDIKAKLVGYKQLARASDYTSAYQGGSPLR